MKQLLVFDLSNLCYIGAKSRATNALPDVELYYDNTLRYLRAQYRYFQPDHVVFACDHEDIYWRSRIFPDYKAQRVDNEFKQTVRQVIKRFKVEKKNVCLEIPHCEADDIIYGLCAFTDFYVTIVSSDGDFEQLLSERVRLFSPTRCEFRERSKDINFDLFVKCIRGDTSDNIPAALPMVTRKRLLEAYRTDDPISYLMQRYRLQTNFKSDFERNKVLIDFNAMPEQFKGSLQQAIQQFFDLCTVPTPTLRGK
jgi:5'-3' exonuclease